MLGRFFLYLALLTKEIDQELSERGFTVYDNALFLSIFAFCNTGIVMTSSSILSLGKNSAALFVLSCILLAGNVMVPVLLRWSVTAVYRISRLFGENKVNAAARYIIKNPRRITTHLFNKDSTVYLVQIAIIGNLLVYFYFLVSSTYRDSMKKYGDTGTVLALGMFQVINFRHSGFQVFDLRDWPEDMLLVSALAMFLSPVPGIGLLHNSGINLK